MNRDGFAQQLDEYFAKRPCEDAQSATRAILKLYEYVETTATDTEALGENSDAWSRNLYLIQQTMSWTPLRLFWEALAQNDSIIIRSCAKGNISEATGEYFGDREIGIIALANLRIMFNEKVVAEIRQEINNAKSVMEAYLLWKVSTHGTDFTPMLRADTL